MIDYMNIDDILKTVCPDMFLIDKVFTPSYSPYFPTITDIPISRVIYSGNKTTVFFIDGTKTTVTCSSMNSYDRQTAIAYALVKRLFGKLGRYDKKAKKYYANEIDGNGLGTKLEKIAKAGFDQDEERKNAKAKKELAKTEHAKRQKAEHDAAWKKRVEKRAEEIRLEREASALADTLTKTGGKKTINESKEPEAMNTKDFFAEANDTTVIKAKNLPKGTTTRTSGLIQVDPKDAWKLYKRPDKPFSQFTSAEKKEYWRYHNAKRRANK